MASCPPPKDEKQSVEEKLKTALTEEVTRRYKFSETLQQLLVERNVRETVNGQSMEELTHKMGMADATISLQLRDLCVESPVSRRRERTSQEAHEERDSGYSPSPATSANLDRERRQAIILRNSVPLPPYVETALPEVIDPPSFPSGMTALDGHAAGEPTEHSDHSPQDD